jgi:glucokinase
MTESPTVLTLDAGGTNFEFRAMRGGSDIAGPLVLPSCGGDLAACLENIVEGFRLQKAAAGGAIHAISFAFPGPADYANGIIGDLTNLPGFRGGVPLGPMLEDVFGVPVLINNDGDLFAYGEALGGVLPEINAELARHGSPRRYRNLLGLTLGTGFGAGFVTEGRLLKGDNSAAAEIWCVRNRLDRESSAEEGVSIRAVRAAYAERAELGPCSVPEPIDIAAIAEGRLPGDAEAAAHAFRRLGQVAGDAAANAVAMLDCLVVVGGGLAGAWRLFLPEMVAEMNRGLHSVTGRGGAPRTELAVFNLEDQGQRALFLRGRATAVEVPRSGGGRVVPYDPQKRVGVTVSKLGAPRAVSLGAYAIAAAHLGKA